MNERRFLFILAILALAFGLWILDRPVPTAAVLSSQPIPAPSTQIAVEPPSAATSPMPVEDLRQEVKAEFQRAGRLDDDPAASERRLDLLAHELTPSETLQLRKMVLSRNDDGDVRAVAVEILARGRSMDAMEALGAIALAPVPSSDEPRLNEFERALRGRAIEGLGEHPSPKADEWLRRATESTPDSFLLDRARRALAARRGSAPSPEQQDREALRRLIL